MDTIYRIAVSYTKTPSDADDIVQQTFVKLLTKRVSFADTENSVTIEMITEAGTPEEDAEIEIIVTDPK